MAHLTLYYHPLSSYCWKALIALYENGSDFIGRVIGPEDETVQAELKELWPLGRFPILRDGDQIVPETSIIVEYVSDRHPGAFQAVPGDGERALEARLMDRLFDNYVMMPMQTLVFDRLRSPDNRDALGVEKARALLDSIYPLLERRIAGRHWAAGENFTLADCAAAPALFYAECVHPFRASHAGLAGYFARLLQRPSVKRCIEESRPYHSLFPGTIPADL